MNTDKEKIILEVENLKKYYPIRKKAFGKTEEYVKSVDGISFSVKENTILGVVGESGCGKSTMGKSILNLIEPTDGRVIYNGKIIYSNDKKECISKSEMTKLRGEMQMIFQDPYASLDPRKSIESIVSEGIKKHRNLTKDEIREKAAEILELCGMDRACMVRYPHEFSGGQRQRIGIARSLAINPKFVVCDEPTAALDVSIQSQILNLMLDLKEKMGLTYIFISHNFNVVKSFCDEIAVMYLGKIVEYGPAEKIYKNPKHPYTQALISSVPRNSPDEKKERIRLTGSIPSAVEIPAGCRFSTRCPYVSDICRQKEPEGMNLDNDRTVYCHLYK